jgi:hypothetical protein
MTAPELKPCPFCGGHFIVVCRGHMRDGSPFTYVECADCAATAESADQWNRRAADLAADPPRDHRTCPLGEDCDLTVAWMAGAADAKRETAALRAKLGEAVEIINRLLRAADQSKMAPKPGHGVGGMTIEANLKGSAYYGVEAWPFEEARATLARITGGEG